jgi:hypothetical protein
MTVSGQRLAAAYRSLENVNRPAIGQRKLNRKLADISQKMKAAISKRNSAWRRKAESQWRKRPGERKLSSAIEKINGVKMQRRPIITAISLAKISA